MTYDWERFWIKKGATYYPDEIGFLQEPNALYSQNSQCKTYSELQDKKLIFLLGEPGIGKSNTLKKIFESLNNNDINAQLINLRSVNDYVSLHKYIFEDTTVKNWLDSENDHTLELLLDSYDEGLLGFANITAQLISEFQKIKPEKLSSLSLRIVCRTAELPEMLEDELVNIFNTDDSISNKDYKDEVSFELLVICKKDALLALESNNINSEDFFEQINTNDLSSFVSRPITLNMLIKLYVQYNKLPDKKWDIYENGLLLLANENNEQRRTIKETGKLSAEERLALATKMAFFFLFTNKKTIYTGNNFSEYIDENSDLDHKILAIDIEDINELINTSLFSARENTKFGFAHRAFIDFLAAKFIIDNNISCNEIYPILKGPTSEYQRIYPQLIEISSWLASKDEYYFDLILQFNPDHIVNGDLAQLSDEQKDKVVKSVLEAIENEKIYEPYGDSLNNFSKLRTKSTSEILIKYILSSPRNIQSRRTAIGITKVCSLLDAEEYIFSILHNSNEILLLRIEAMKCLLRINSGNYIQEIKQYAYGFDSDINDELKALALQILYPKHIDIKKCLSYITQPKKSDRIATYQHFLSYMFCNATDITQIQDVVSWICKNYNKNIYKLMINSIFLKLWKHLEKDDNLEIFIELLIFNKKNNLRFPEIKDRFVNLLNYDIDKRRKVISKLVSQQAEYSKELSSTLSNNELRLQEDHSWYIEQIKKTEIDNEISIYAKLLKYNRDFSSDDNILKSILDLSSNKQAFYEVFKDNIKAIELNSDAAKNQKEDFYRDENDLNEYILEIQNEIIQSIEMLEYDTENISKLIYNFVDIEEVYESQRYDKSTMFNFLENDKKKKVIDILHYYLNSNSLIDELNFDENCYIIYPQVCRAYELIHYLDNGSLEQVEPSVIGNHVLILMYMSIVHERYISIETSSLLVNKLYKHDTNLLNSAFIKLLRLFELKDITGDPCSYLYSIELIHNATLNNLMSLVYENILSIDLEMYVLSFLIKHDYAQAIEYINELVKLPRWYEKIILTKRVNNEFTDSQIINALRLLTISKIKDIKRVILYLKSNKDIAIKYISEISKLADEETITYDFTENELAQLYILIYKVHPPINDSMNEARQFGSAVKVTPEIRVADLRRNLLHKLVSCNTKESISALKYIFNILPEHKNKKFYINDAVENTNRAQFTFYKSSFLQKIISSKGNK